MSKEVNYKIKSIKEADGNINEGETGKSFDIVLEKPVKEVSSFSLPAKDKEDALKKADDFINNLPEPIKPFNVEE